VVRALFIVAIALTLTAARAEEEAAIRGLGAHSCAQFAAGSDGRTPLGDVGAGLYGSKNVQFALERKPRRNIPAVETLDATMRQMCAERAPSPLWTVVLDYFRSLPELPP